MTAVTLNCCRPRGVRKMAAIVHPMKNGLLRLNTVAKYHWRARYIVLELLCEESTITSQKNSTDLPRC